jgi:hypothetical protein
MERARGCLWENAGFYGKPGSVTLKLADCDDNLDFTGCSEVAESSTRSSMPVLRQEFRCLSAGDLGENILRACVRLATWMLLLPAMVAGAERVPVAEFSKSQLASWKQRSFAGDTLYQLESVDGPAVLRADSRGSASGLYREVDVDLQQTPILNWSWRVERLFQGNDETTRAGDDYPARVYVVFSGGMWFLRTRAINYVWSSHQPVGAQWPNAFTGNARMMAVDSGETGLGEWRNRKRNVLEDYRRLFGDDPPAVKAVAIMTDSDNTGQWATAWYGDIWFSSATEPSGGD